MNPLKYGLLLFMMWLIYTYFNLIICTFVACISLLTGYILYITRNTNQGERLLILEFMINLIKYIMTRPPDLFILIELIKNVNIKMIEVSAIANLRAETIGNHYQ